MRIKLPKGLNMKKTSNRRERIKFICQKRGQRISDIFILMTDQEVKQYFDAVYLNRRDKPDATGRMMKQYNVSDVDVMWNIIMSVRA